MTDDLNERLAAWVAPSLPDATRLRLDALLTDSRVPGPRPASRTHRWRLLPLGYATAVGLLLLAVSQRPTPLPAWTRHDLEPSAPLVPTPGLSEWTQRSATAVSAVDLQGFQPIDNPRIHVNRSTP